MSRFLGDLLLSASYLFWQKPVYTFHHLRSAVHDTRLWIVYRGGPTWTGRFQMQGGKNWTLRKEINANRFFWDSHRLEIWKTTYIPLWDRMEGTWLWTQHRVANPRVIYAESKCGTKKYIYTVHRVPQCLPPPRNWDRPTPLFRKWLCIPPPLNQRWARSPAGEEVGESQFGRLEKKLSILSTLCVVLSADQR